MPEGPECHAAAAFLRRQCVGRRLVAAIIAHGRYVKKDPKGWDLLGTALADVGPLAIEAVEVHGKMIYLVLANGMCIVTTLGLTGKWQTRCTRHAGLCLVLDKGRLWFKDQLHYGTLSIISLEECQRRIAKLGPDCTQGPGTICCDYWQTMCDKHQEKQVSVLLMNQNIVAGIGNYLKNEILHSAGVHPCAEVRDLSSQERQELLDHALVVVHTWWRYKMRLTATRPKMQVYRRKRTPGGDEVMKVKTADGRTSHTTLTQPPPPPSPPERVATSGPPCPLGCTR